MLPRPFAGIREIRLACGALREETPSGRSTITSMRRPSSEHASHLPGVLDHEMSAVGNRLCWWTVSQLGRLPRLSTVSVTALLSVSLPGCESSGVVLPPMMFEEAFVLVDSLELEQPPNLPIVGIGSLDISAEGEVLVTDPPEARVSLFSPSGELLQVFGRRGEGAGEFEYPTHARFDERGDIHVVDIQRRLISIFSRSGGLKRNIRLPPGLVPHSIEVVEQGAYWLTGIAQPGSHSDNVLFKLDTLGVITAEYLPLASARPRRQRNHQDWFSIRNVSIAMGEHGPFVSFSLLDSIWALDEMSGDVQSWAIRPEGYVAPSLPENPITSASALMEWVEASQRAIGIWSHDRYLVVPFTSGMYHRAESSVASYKDVTGVWHTLLDTPVILGSEGPRLFALARPIGERVVINIFELRSHTQRPRYRQPQQQ